MHLHCDNETLAEQLAEYGKNTSEHALEIVHDDGVFRHLKFNKGGSSIYGFSITTWPGHLAITGDMGDYVFCRAQDMFEFFRTGIQADGKTINPSYWHEKLVSDSVRSPSTEFCPDVFKDSVQEELDRYFESNGEAHKTRLTADVRTDVLSRAQGPADEHDAYQALADYHDRETGFHFDMTDFGMSREYTPHYLWCLYAIVDVVDRYDQLKAKPAAKVQSGCRPGV